MATEKNFGDDAKTLGDVNNSAQNESKATVAKSKVEA